jgi:transposase
MNTPQIAGFHSLLWRFCGQRDPTMLPGVADHVWLQLIGEVGTDLGKNWRTEKHFTAWLGLAPGSRQSGKWRGGQKRSRNRAGRLFCVMARSVRTQCGQGAGRLLSATQRPTRRSGANLALARKLAEMFWRLMVHGRPYVEEGLKKYEEKVAVTKQWLLQNWLANITLFLNPRNGSWKEFTSQRG